MKGFWCDGDGLTVVEVLAITLGLGSIGLYWRFGGIDTSYADITVAAILGAAGQKVGYKWVNGRERIANEGCQPVASSVAGEGQKSD